MSDGTDVNILIDLLFLEKEHGVKYWLNKRGVNTTYLPQYDNCLITEVGVSFYTGENCYGIETDKENALVIQHQWKLARLAETFKNKDFEYHIWPKKKKEEKEIKNPKPYVIAKYEICKCGIGGYKNHSTLEEESVESGMRHSHADWSFYPRIFTDYFCKRCEGMYYAIKFAKEQLKEDKAQEKLEIAESAIQQKRLAAIYQNTKKIHIDAYKKVKIPLVKQKTSKIEVGEPKSSGKCTLCSDTLTSSTKITCDTCKVSIHMVCLNELSKGKCPTLGCA